MRPARRSLLLVIGVYLVCSGVSWARLVGYQPLATAERQADVVVVAKVEGAVAETKAAIRVQLGIVRVLKGTSIPSVVTAELAPSRAMAAAALTPQGMVTSGASGATGLWFLKEDNGSFSVLPLGWGDYFWDDAFLPLPSPELPEPATVIPGLASNGSRAYNLALAALLNAYLSSHPLGRFHNILVASLNDRDQRQDSLAVARVLLASDTPEHQILGLEAALRLGADEVLPVLAQKVEALRSNQLFPGVTFALGTEYKPNGEASIAPLRQLASMHLGAADFEAAVASALRKIGTRAIVPAMVEFLDSQDPTAQLHASRFLSDYALFADADGNVPVLKPGQGRTFGPWRTEAVHEYTPSRDSTKTPQEYAAFWKSWWAENKAKLGFTGP